MREEPNPEPTEFATRGILATPGTWPIFGGLWASGRLRASREVLVVSNPLKRIVLPRDEVAQVQVIRYWISTRGISVTLTSGRQGRWRFALTTEDLDRTISALEALNWPIARETPV